MILQKKSHLINNARCQVSNFVVYLPASQISCYCYTFLIIVLFY